MSAISKVGSSEHAEGTSAARLEEAVARREKFRYEQKAQARRDEAARAASESEALREQFRQMTEEVAESSSDETMSKSLDVEA